MKVLRPNDPAIGKTKIEQRRHGNTPLMLTIGHRQVRKMTLRNSPLGLDDTVTKDICVPIVARRRNPRIELILCM